MVILKIEIQGIFLIIQLFIFYFYFFFIGKQLCLFYVVYFGWAEPSLPQGFFFFFNFILFLNFTILYWFCQILK